MLTFLTTTALLAFSPSPAHHRPRAARPRAAVSSPRMDEEPDDGADRLVPAVLHTEMQDSYMSYAMSVIMSRALPDARDGLKPVHRRILYAMHELGLQPEGPHRKCARVVGEVLGKYHPHGDNSVYDALVRMAQDFSLRSPLVDGHGNFGSVDPDPPAAMRYTECKLTKLAREALLADVAMDTVDYTDNFDGSEREPVVLPAKLPMLLLNGASGIAVGMATNCPPHNLGEVCDALRGLIADPELSDDELFELIPAPDFPTGGEILGRSGAHELYRTGRGSVQLRAKAHTESLPRERGAAREAIVVTELPYATQKNGLLEKVASLVNEKKLEGISDIRDESTMEGLRIIFELKRDAESAVVLNNLYKRTQLQQAFAGNLMAVLGGGRMPELLTLRRALQEFLDFRVECVQRRCAFQLRKAETRLHLVEGLLLALGRLDAVVDAIRQARGAAEARAILESAQFGLSPEQAEAILSMQLRRLTALENEALQAEEAELRETIGSLQLLLAERDRVLAQISDELGELKHKYATPRRTALGAPAADLTDGELIAEESAIVIMTASGNIKRLALAEFDAQRRGTRGKAGMTLSREADDAVARMFTCSSHDGLLCVTGRGIAYLVPAFRVPSASRTSRGVKLHQLLPIEPTDSIATVLSVTPAQLASDDAFLLLLTRHGWIKKTPLKAFAKISARGLIATKVGDGDEVLRCEMCSSADSVLLASQRGQSLHFATDTKQLRASGRLSRGVKSMNLRDGDRIADMSVVVHDSAAAAATAAATDDDDDDDEADDDDDDDDDGDVAAAAGGDRPGQLATLLAVTRDGFGKRVRTSSFGKKSRGGMGMIAIKFKRDTDSLVALTQADADDQVLIITQKGTIVRQRVAVISRQGRAATGVRLQNLDDDDYVASVAIVPAGAAGDDDDDDELEEELEEEESDDDDGAQKSSSDIFQIDEN